MNILNNIIKLYIPKNTVTAENSIYSASKNKIRPLEVEKLYMEVRYRFKEKMRKGELHRFTIIKIRKYLEDNVCIYYHQNFKNDAHCVYSLLKAKDLKVKHLKELQRIMK